VRAADADARREFDAMRSATRAITASAPATAPAAVTPSDRRDTPGYEREPDADIDSDPDADPGDARDDDARRA